MKTKKPKARLKKDEQIIGRAVPLKMLNQKRLAKLKGKRTLKKK